MTKKILKRAEGVESEKVVSKLAPASLNIEERTVRSVLTTTRKVLRSVWWDEPFYEVLSTDPKHVRTERLDNGIPVLDGHDWSGSVLKQLGIAKGYEVKGEEIETVLRFSKKPDAEIVFQDVIDGICTTTSIGYRVFEYEDISPADRQPGEPATFKAIDYEIFEISMVPIPADPGALLRSDKGVQMPKKLKRTEEEAASKAKKAEGDEEEEEEGTTEAGEGDSSEDAEAEKKAASEEVEEKKAEGDDEEEKEDEGRSLKILKMARTAGLSLEKTEEMIRSKSSLTDISDKILSDMAARQGGAKMSKAEIITDEKSVKREGIRNAILVRAGSRSVKVDENSRRFMNMRLLDMVRNYLNLGWDVSNDEAARRAFHSSSDFTNILTDAMNVSLAFEYAEIAQTFEPIVKRTTVRDFREKHIIDYGSFPKLQKLGETGEIKAGSMSDGKNTMKIDSYASKINISRKTIINDELDVFSKLPFLAAQAARDLEADLVYAVLTSNPNMGDGKTLFHADHKNVIAAGNIEFAKISAAVAAMKTQKGLDGKAITVVPEYLVVPVALEAAALQFINTNFMAAKQSDTNPYASMFKGVIADQRLDASSASKYYLSSSANRAGVIELATLEGEGMKLNVEEKFGTGITYEALYDVGAAPVDHKGLCLVGAV